MLLTITLSGCSEQLEEVVPTVSENDELRVSTLYINLPGANVDSRLSYEEINGKSFKTYWEETDVIVANPTPGTTENAYVYNLVDGAGTGSGTFECKVLPNIYLPENWESNAWTIYYPGSKIYGEQDYLDFSYVGQVQKGNNNYDHIGDYHSIRLLCSPDMSTSKYFNSDYINFSGDNFEQSACMKFNLSGFETAIVPKKIELMYADANGNFQSCFHTYNFLDLSVTWSGATPHYDTSSKLSLELTDFEATNSITAYMMMSNYPVSLQQGGKMRVCVITEDGKRYCCDKEISANITLKGGLMHRITCSSWTEESVSSYDGMETPEGNIFVLQEATVGNGTDIIIMGDGFSESHFANGNYETIMKQAYDDFFSVEPYASLKEYFNVYYINAVSQEDHDAVPHYSGNGATNGDAVTIFNTKFTEGSTNITGNDGMVRQYAQQAIRYKGGKGGTECTDAEAGKRADLSLSMVMVNVPCHAGTCSLSWVKSEDWDYGYALSIAYTSLNPSEEDRRLTTVHEAGGHGFGKLADEYGGFIFTTFNTAVWNNLSANHTFGVSRNVNEYWGQEERNDGWNLPWTDTTVDNVYWTELLNSAYSYVSDEGLGIYRGGNTYNHLFCRSTENSIMRNHFANVENGQYFNAISRWAIWYRLMRLTGSTTATRFKNSLEEFVAWDRTIPNRWSTSASTRSVNYVEDNQLLPLAPPVMIEGRWVNGRLVLME